MVDSQTLSEFLINTKEKTVRSHNDSSILSQETISGPCRSLSQEGDTEFKNQPFGRIRKQNHKTFYIKFDESENTNTTSTVPDLGNNLLPFKRKNKLTEDAFNVNFDETGFHDTDKSTESFHVVNNFRKKKYKTANFQISFSESLQETEVGGNYVNRTSAKESNEVATSPFSKSQKSLNNVVEAPSELDGNDFITASSSVTSGRENGNTELSSSGSTVKTPSLGTSYNSVEDTLNAASPQESNKALSQGSNDFEQQLSQHHKREGNDAFDIEDDILNTASSQESNEAISQGSTENFKKPKPFMHQAGQVRNDAFDIEDDILNTASSQESNEAISQGSTENFKKSKLFMHQKGQGTDAFDVGYEESDTSTCIPDSSSLTNKAVPFRTIKRASKQHDINIGFDDSSTRNDSNHSLGTTDQKKIFCKKLEPLNNNFEISFERSALENDKEIDFERKSYNDSTHAVNASYISRNSMSNGKLNLCENSEHISNFSNNSNPSISALSSVSKSQSKIWNKKDVNMSETSNTIFDQCSFNDENLNEWMSDHSNDSILCDQREIEKSKEHNDIAMCPVETNIPPEIAEDPDASEEEKLRLKLKTIVDNARKGNEQSTLGPWAKNVDLAKAKRIVHENKKVNVHEKPKLKKPAKFVTRRLYEHIIKKLRPKYGIDCILQAEDVVLSLCETVKKVTRRRTYQKKMLNDLKLEMAKHGLIETTYDFYEFVRNFLPYEFRVKVIPCAQPITNIIYPPKDARSPFDKILEK